MALLSSITITNSFGDTKEFADAYTKITSLVGNKSTIVARWNAFEEKDGRDVGNGQVIFAPDLEGNNFIKQAYLHLKTLPEFSDAVDC
jgi:hypothetical protein